ncbi:MAG: hypothetical protein GXO48_08100 [Chlorobi bacterium]|nr:hypothetical protein [Chlorobiota bacterium]
MLLIMEVVLASLVFISLILWEFYSQTTASLLFFSSVTLAFFYMSVGVILFKAHKEKSFAIPLSIIASIGIALSVIGILFKSLNWPGGMLQLKVGLSLLFIIAILSFLLYLRTKSSVYLHLLVRSIIYSGVSAIVLLF